MDFKMDLVDKEMDKTLTEVDSTIEVEELDFKIEVEMEEDKDIKTGSIV